MVPSGGAQTVGDTVGTNAGIKSDIVIDVTGNPSRNGGTVRSGNRDEASSFQPFQ